MSKFSKHGIVLAVLSLLLFIGCSDNSSGTSGSKSYKKVEIGENSTILCLGNSLTVGYGASDTYPYVDENKSYPANLSKKVNIDVEIFGKSGIMTSEAANTVTNGSIDSYLVNAAVIIIELGANDLFEQMENAFYGEVDSNFVEDVEENFRTILDYINSFGTDPQIYLAKFYNKTIAQQLLKGKLYEIYPYNYMFVYDDYENMFKRLKSEYDVELITNIWDGGIWGNINYMFDEDGNGKIEIFEAEDMPEVHPNAAGYEKMADNYFSAMKGFLEFNELVK